MLEARFPALEPKSSKKTCIFLPKHQKKNLLDFHGAHTLVPSFPHSEWPSWDGV